MSSVILEIEPNPNCAAADMRVFHALEAPQPVSQIRLERAPGGARWYDVTGWTGTGTPCPALMRKVDDSGDGVALLLYGGDGGLRLRPAGDQIPWRLDETSQFGEPFLVLGDPHDVRLTPQPLGCGTPPRPRWSGLRPQPLGCGTPPRPRWSGLRPQPEGGRSDGHGHG